MPLVRRTRATLRSAEFGFFGVIVYTRVQTPRRCGAATFFLRPLPDFRPGVVTFLPGDLRPLRISWLVVGMRRVMLAAGGGRPHAAPLGVSASSSGVYGSPTASATGAYVMWPPATLTPRASPGLPVT